MTQVGGTELDRQLVPESGQRVIQVVPWFAVNDAIGQHIREIDAIVSELGIRSSIVALRCEEGLAGMCVALSDLVVGPNDVVIYHFSSGSEATAIVESLRCRVIVDYHNITPARFFESWSAELAVETKDW